MRIKTKMLIELFARIPSHHPREIMVQHRKFAYGRIKRSMVMKGHKWVRSEMIKSAMVLLGECP